MTQAMSRKQEIAIAIALQTRVLKTCTVHNQLFCDDETYTDDENMGRAFALAIELIRQHDRYAEEFHQSTHELTDLLSDVIGAAPTRCPDCEMAQLPRVNDPSSEAYAFR
jgi:hypothetical protein